MRRSHVRAALAKNTARVCDGIENCATSAPWAVYHRCELEWGHMGRHLCWCGLAFGRPDTNWRQAKLPLIPLEDASS